MPNVDPKTLPIQPWPWGPVCTNGTCIEAKRADDGVHLTSNIPGNDGLLIGTHDEWAAFVGQVKRGEWDHTL